MYNQLIKVSRGFKLVYIGTMLIVLAVVFGILGMCVTGGVLAAAGGKGAGGAAGLVLVIAGGIALAVLAGGIIGLIGRFFCLAVPDRAGSAKPMIIISLVLELLGMGAGILNNVSDLLGGRLIPPAAKPVVAGTSILCSIGSAILFLLFTRAAAKFVRRSDLADKALSVLWLWLSTVGCYILGFVFMIVGVGLAGPPRGNNAGGGIAAAACVGLIPMLIALVLALVAVIKYITLLKEMSEATASYARRTKRSKRDREDYDDDDDDDDEDDYRPRSRRPSRYDDDEDDEDDRPRGHGRRSSRYDDDEDEDDRPRRRDRRDR